MLYNINLEKILFLDIETVPMVKEYKLLPDNFKKLWDHKSKFIKREEDDTPETLFPRAGIYAEFGKIVCISVGYLHNREFRIKSFYGDDELILLKEFAQLLETYFNHRDNILCAHNGKEFDFPYIARRLLINGLPLPAIINIAGKKPWEVAHLDTMELWKFGDYKNYTSLELLSVVFGIPTPKDDIDGSQVAQVYYEDNDLERIAEYCQRDTLTVAQLLLSYLGKPKIRGEDVVIS
ncbi:MAG: 3'-5' exonuclease [Bacteroidales bacterium]|nr:3'-5' exonuclease [Bacteroidales bacterium]MCF8404597.1 3'-5' exonuclease [Bacteroidales bacterium]